MNNSEANQSSKVSIFMQPDVPFCFLNNKWEVSCLPAQRDPWDCLCTCQHFIVMLWTSTNTPARLSFQLQSSVKALVIKDISNSGHEILLTFTILVFWVLLFRFYFESFVSIFNPFTGSWIRTDCINVTILQKIGICIQLERELKVFLTFWKCSKLY